MYALKHEQKSGICESIAEALIMKEFSKERLEGVFESPY